jgi:AcrR family transcriptional regulator
MSRPPTQIPDAGGLRARKKQECRRKIAAEAERLFRERGYQHVRMIDIARAAGVSEPTLYNYFPTKEHLIFDMDQELEERIVECVRGLAPGKELVDAVRKGALQFLDDLCRSSAGKATGIPESVLQGEALQQVWLQLNSRMAHRVAETIRSVENRKVPRATAIILGRSIVAVFATILEEYGVGRLEGKGAEPLRREIRTAIVQLLGGLKTMPCIGKRSPQARC